MILKAIIEAVKLIALSIYLRYSSICGHLIWSQAMASVIGRASTAVYVSNISYAIDVRGGDDDCEYSANDIEEELGIAVGSM